MEVAEKLANAPDGRPVTSAGAKATVPLKPFELAPVMVKGALVAPAATAMDEGAALNK
jgi:hypothetical protein